MKEKEVITIKDKVYTVISVVKIEKQEYAYIINMDNFKEALFIKTQKNAIEIISEKEKLKNLIHLFHLKINRQKLSENG